MHVASDEELSSLIKTSPIVVVKCGANWCGPCKMIEPTFQAVGKQLKDAAQWISIDVETCPEFMETWKIRQLPTFLIFRNGKLQVKWTGANVTAFKEHIRAYFRPQ